MFAILAAIGVMFGLSLARVPVVFALIIGAVTGGLLAGLGLQLAGFGLLLRFWAAQKLRWLTGF